MKSQLFQKKDLASNERFSSDIKKLLSLETRVLSQLASFVLKAFEASTEGETDAVYQEASSITGVQRAILDYALDVGEFLMRQFAPKGIASEDSVETILEDLTTIYGVEDSKKDSLIEFLTELKKASKEKVAAILLERSHTHAGLQTLESVEVCVDFRIVFDNYFKSGEDITAFSPQFIGTVPLGLIRLGLTNGLVENISFQVTKRSLQLLVDNLVALQKQIEIAEKNVGTS